MSGEACPIPTSPGAQEEKVIQRLLAGHRVAVVGASDSPDRAAYYVPEYLRSAGKEILPVNPSHEQVMGLKCHKSLAEVPGPIDVVEVFRRAEACPQVVREAVAAGARGVWLQSGIVSDEAKRIAQEAGIDFVQNRCMMVEHRRHGR